LIFGSRGPLGIAEGQAEIWSADAATGQSTETQPGAGCWAEAYAASGHLAEEIAKLKAQEGKRQKAKGSHWRQAPAVPWPSRF